MMKFFINPDDTSRRVRFALSSDDEMQAGRALIRIADHQAGRTTLLASGKRVVASMVRQEHLVDLRPWFEQGETSFLARMRELGGEAEGWMRYRISLKLYRFPALSGVLSRAIKEKPLRVRRAARSNGGQAEVFYRANDLRLTFHMNPEALDYWVSVGILPADAFPSGQRSRISSEAFENVKKLFDGSCSQTEASNRLGCANHVVRKLIQFGALKRSHLLPTVARDRVELSSLHHLIRTFLSRFAAGRMQVQCISFEEAIDAIQTAQDWEVFRSHIELGTSVYWVEEGNPRLGDVRFPFDEMVRVGLLGIARLRHRGAHRRG
ncbi:hypothetical protein QTH90_15190 [Variovorax sp. J2P1-59]|uniref:hypothetical protein n=1 Tax=Variovorax flavidus TaxID=3053501 RepID=UPI002577107D|nr:hypothetical protein [Variovorax sp. J2P1-59]MDM0075746.1 hypothetical protein [Variovorax sp. J2P1-59]